MPAKELTKTQSDQWVVLELGPKAEGEDPDLIKASIRHMIRDAEVFIPASVTKNGDDKVIQYLVDGYAFIRRNHPDTHYLRLEDSKYVQTILREPAVYIKGQKPIKAIASVPTIQIEKLRQQIKVEVDQGIGIGDTVLITSGAYKQITARVEEEIAEQDSVQVFVHLRSKEALITIPRACLKLVSKAPKSVLQNKFLSLKKWLDLTNTLINWPEGKAKIAWDKIQKYIKLTYWLENGNQLHTVFFKSLSIEPVNTQFQKWETIETAMSKLNTLGKELSEIEKSLTAKRGRSVVSKHAKQPKRNLRVKQKTPTKSRASKKNSKKPNR